MPSERRISAELRAARSDARVMGAWLRRSFREWLEADSAAGPLLIVLEDLHWGDLPSVEYLGEARDLEMSKFIQAPRPRGCPRLYPLPARMTRRRSPFRSGDSKG